MTQWPQCAITIHGTLVLNLLEVALSALTHACRTDMGGGAADRSPEQGASSICWLLEHSGADVTGGFYRDGEEIAW
jgi:hypothetical protein